MDYRLRKTPDGQYQLIKKAVLADVDANKARPSVYSARQMISRIEGWSCEDTLDFDPAFIELARLDGIDRRIYREYCRRIFGAKIIGED